MAAVKMTGEEFSRFYADEAVWGSGTKSRWHEDSEIIIDGVNSDENDDLDMGNFAPTAKVTVSGGVVYAHDGSEVDSLEGLARKWKKLQTTVSGVFSVPKDKLEELKAVLKALGGKVEA